MKNKIIRFFMYDIMLFCVFCGFAAADSKFRLSQVAYTVFVALTAVTVYMFILLAVDSVAMLFWRKKVEDVAARFYIFGLKICIACCSAQFLFGLFDYMTNASGMFPGLFGWLLMVASSLWLIPIFLFYFFDRLEKKSEGFRVKISGTIKRHERILAYICAAFFLIMLFGNVGF